MLFDAHWHGFVRGVLEPVADRPLPSAASRSAASTTAGVVRHWSEELPVDAPSVQAPLATDAKTAVDRVGRGKERRVNMRFLAMANHYVFEPAFCNPAAGWEKGQIEKNVQDVARQSR